MTLRQALGGDARRVHELVDQLLDSEDALVMLIDGKRAISYAEGFGLSARPPKRSAGTPPMWRRT
jgi:hypothetical protein